MELTSQHVSDGTISWLIGHFSVRRQADASIHSKTWEEVIAALLELKQRRAEDRQREAMNGQPAA